MNFINKIIDFSLRNRLLVLLGALLVLVAGVWSSKKMDVDVFPDLTAPTVVIMTDAQGMASEEVERLVTFPIETAMNGATDVRRVRSASTQGNSFVWVEFDWGTDIFKARQIVSEKMVALSESLPEGLTPMLAPQSSVMGEILFIGLQSDSTSMMDLRTLADWVIKPAILATGGVSQVTNIGGELKQYHILADPQKMDYYGVTMEEVEAIGRSFSDNSVGGVVRDFGNEFALRGMGRTTDVEELGNTLVKMKNGKPVMLADVAEVKIAPAQKMGNASQNGKPAVILSVSKQPNINTLEVTEAIEKNLDAIRKSLPADVKMDTRIFRQADFIESSVDNVGSSLIEGALFAVLILFVFLASIRTTLISIVAIPLSLLGSCVVLYLLGMNINTMTLGGMCIAIGSLVDDAIIDVENVYKRLRENHALPKEERLPVIKVVFEASKEIRSSILNATFIIMVAFLPLFFLSGLEGRMLKPLGIAYIIALFMSLIVAMTVTPLLCRMMLTDDKYLTRRQKESVVSRKLSDWYFRSLQWALAHAKIVGGVTVGVLVVAIGLFMTMGSSFLPDFNEGSATISAVAKPGVSLMVNDELGQMMEQELMKVPEVTGTARRTGRGELDEHSQATNGAEIDVQFKLDGRSKDEVFDDMRGRLANVPGIAATIGQPLGHRIDHMVSGTRAAIAIKIFGTDLSDMYSIGNRIKGYVEDIPGAVDVSVEQQVETPQLQVRANRDALARYGITMEQFHKFIDLAFSGEKIADIYEGQRKFDVVLRLDKSYTDNIEGVKNALIETASGRRVPLEEVADIVSVGGPNSISRENVQRKLVVSANVSGRDVVSVVNDIRKAVDKNIELPEGYRIEYGGQFESAKSASRTLFFTTVLALMVIFLLLYSEFKDVSLAAIVLLNLPFALVGGVLAVYFTSGVVSIPVIIGFITLFGIATRNGILLISKYQRLMKEGVTIEDTVLHGSIDRLNPILMTALTSALALIPLIIHGDKSGNEIQSPMAVVVLGGLLTSTLLNIYMMPIVYKWFVERKIKKNENTK
ncbi:MAG: efflux RND transporter permease subunit [Bacteroides sp.]|nr:efflux RND transporter permease subunit [Bacteroides sp.]